MLLPFYRSSSPTTISPRSTRKKLRLGDLSSHQVRRQSSSEANHSVARLHLMLDRIRELSKDEIVSLCVFFGAKFSESQAWQNRWPILKDILPDSLSWPSNDFQRPRLGSEFELNIYRAFVLRDRTQLCRWLDQVIIACEDAMAHIRTCSRDDEEGTGPAAIKISYMLTFPADMVRIWLGKSNLPVDEQILPRTTFLEFSSRVVVALEKLSSDYRHDFVKAALRAAREAEVIFQSAAN